MLVEHRRLSKRDADLIRANFAFYWAAYGRASEWKRQRGRKSISASTAEALQLASHEAFVHLA